MINHLHLLLINETNAFMLRRESTRIGMKVEEDMAEYHDFKNSLVEMKRKQTMNLVA